MIADFLPRIIAGDFAAALILADYLDEHNDPRAAEVRRLARITPRELAARVYAARQDRSAHPEGDHSGHWHPSDREDAEEVLGRIRPPSSRWPWSYMLACRTRTHCTKLVLRCLAGEDVPPDVRAVCRGPVDAILALLGRYYVVGVDQHGTRREQGCATRADAYAVRDAWLDAGWDVRIVGLPTMGGTGTQTIPL